MHLLMQQRQYNHNNAYAAIPTMPAQQRLDEMMWRALNRVLSHD
jgi:hypothetical protein